MKNIAQRPHTTADTQIQAELAMLHKKLDLVREVRERELRRRAVQSLNRRQPTSRLGLTIASLLVIATALAGAVSLAVFLLANN